jgi:tRNA(fMet)-specific endonuclease VapC
VTFMRIASSQPAQSRSYEVTVIGVDEKTARLFGKERGRLRAEGKRVADFDLLIGVTARQHQLTLLTNDRRHFEDIEGLEIESLL